MARISKRVDENGRAYAGSQRQIQAYVNEHTSGLSEAVASALGRVGLPANAAISWVSPLCCESYCEYNDKGFLYALGLSDLFRALRAFWPPNGPVWDALAKVRTDGINSSDGVILVEAKSRPSEVFGSYCKAIGLQRELILRSLAATKGWLGVAEDVSWTWDVYQFANRLAHLYFLREVVGIQAWLVYVYFLDDPHSPTNLNEWEQTKASMKAKLGVAGKTIPFFAEVMLPASGVPLSTGDSGLSAVSDRAGGSQIRALQSVSCLPQRRATRIDSRSRGRK
jgi:hypothetical protein